MIGQPNFAKTVLSVQFRKNFWKPTNLLKENFFSVRVRRSVQQFYIYKKRNLLGNDFGCSVSKSYKFWKKNIVWFIK